MPRSTLKGQLFTDGFVLIIQRQIFNDFLRVLGYPMKPFYALADEY